MTTARSMPGDGPPPGPEVEPSARALRRARPRSWVARVAIDVLGRLGAQIGLAWVVLVALAAVFAPLIANSHPFLIRRGGELEMPFLRFLSAADVSLLVALVTLFVLLALRGLRGRLRTLLYLVITGAVVAVSAWPAVSNTAAAWLYRQGWQQTAYALRDAGDVPWFYAVGAAVVVVALALTWWVLRHQQGRHRSKAIVYGWLLLVTVPAVVWPVDPPQLVVYEQWREAAEAGEIEVLLTAPIPYSPTDRLRDRFDPMNPHPRDPSAEHLLGTERYGADILSRMIWASRIALSIGFIATGISLVIGVVLGGLMGYFAGAVDLFGMRLVEIFSAIPQLYLLLSFVAFFGRNLYFIMIIIGLTSWTGYAVFTRAEFLKLRNQDFVAAARACALPLRSILFRHILPNALAPILVSVSFGVASAILAEATLSFLGLGLVDQPSWGELLNQAVSAGGGFYWWLATFPGLAIFLTVFAYNMIGEALRDAIDPRTRRQEA